MNQQTQQALLSFSKILQARQSVLTDTDSRVGLNMNQVTDKVMASVFVPFEERCEITRSRKASWIFNRRENKFVLNRLYPAGKAQLQ